MVYAPEGNELLTWTDQKVYKLEYRSPAVDG